MSLGSEMCPYGDGMCLQGELAPTAVCRAAQPWARDTVAPPHVVGLAHLLMDIFVEHLLSIGNVVQKG